MGRDVRLRQLKAVFVLELGRLSRTREGRATAFFALAPLLLSISGLVVRGQARPARVAPMPFAPHRYYRG